MDQVEVRRVLRDRLHALGCTSIADEESGDPIPEFFEVPGLRKESDDRISGEKWTGSRHGRNVSVWRGSKWFQLADEVRVSGPAPALEATGDRGRWVGAAAAASPVLASADPGPGRIRVRAGPDGVQIRRRLTSRQFLTPEGTSIHWADLLLAERLAGSGPAAAAPG
jgi:hypothetical protein